MPVKFKIDVKLDLNEFLSSFEHEIKKKSAEEGVRIAKKLVRKDTRELENSISTDVLNNGDYVYSTDKVYGPAQEYGLEPYELPQYGYTPYMRPSAFRVINGIYELAVKAVDEAIKDARI